MSATDAVCARDDFPLLARRAAAGQPLVYLDSAATALAPRVVCDAVRDHMAHCCASPHRGTHPLAGEATRRYEDGRRAIAALCGADPAGTVIAAGATAAINLVRHTWGRCNVKAGDVVAVTAMEHHSNLLPWRALCAQAGARLEVVPVDGAGRLDLDALERLLRSAPVRLVAAPHVSNVLGTVNPIETLARLAHEHGAVALVDGAQAVTHLPVDVRALDADFYVWSGHKALGPSGVGVLCAKPALLERMPPFLLGGEMVESVRPDGLALKAPPWRFEAGTPPVAEAIGLAAAAEYLVATGLERIAAHDRALTSHALALLGERRDVRVAGPPSARQRAAVVAFRLDGVHPHDVAELLGRRGICVRAGYHCAEPLAREIGGPTVRISFGPYTTADDVSACVAALDDARRLLGERAA